MHSTQDQKNNTDFDTFELDDLAKRGHGASSRQRQCDVAHVDQVEANDQQVIDAVGKLGVAVKGVDEEDATAPLESSRYPDREGDADKEITEVAGCDIHMRYPFFKFEHVQ